MPATCPITAAIPTWRRPDKLRQAFDHILACDPAPAEILIHIDAGDDVTAPLLEREYRGQATWFASQTTQGPGGGRNHLFQRAQNEIIAGFDDDSWPYDRDYFAVAMELLSGRPRAAVLSAQEIRPGAAAPPRGGESQPVNSFQNCACVMRKAAFLETQGFVPLRYAYGMEETDLALQLLDRGWQILATPALRVYHDTAFVHHQTPEINASHIRNIGLLAFLRFSPRYWFWGVLRVANRVRFAAAAGQYQGIFSGLAAIPLACWRYRRARKPVRSSTLLLSRRLAKTRS